MARTPHPPDEAQRFFARVLGAVFECPKCGYLYKFGPGQADRTHNARYDPRTSRFQCDKCGLTLMFGLLAWPVEKGDPRPPTLPRDQVPTPRQVAELRQAEHGWWMVKPKRRHRAEDTNQTAACLCVGSGGAGGVVWNPDCPLHRGEGGVGNQQGRK